MNPNANEPEVNQPGSEETDSPAAKTDELLMQMTLEPRKQRDNSQKQSSLMAAENVADNINAYERQGKEAKKKNWKNTSKKLVLNLALGQIPNTSLSQENENLSSDEVVYDGPNTNTIRPKRRK